MTQGGDLPRFDPRTTTSVTLVDVNNDELDDVIVTSTSGHPSRVYINPGDGMFSEVTPTDIASTTPMTTTCVEVVDINLDGVPDLVLGNSNAANQVVLGAPSSVGDFTTSTLLPFGAETDVTKGIRVADIDRDGAADIIVGNEGQSNKVYFGTPGTSSGDYSSPSVEIVVGRQSKSTSSVEVADLDGDGNVDLIFGNRGQESEIYWNQQPSTSRQTLPAAAPKYIGSSGTNPNDVKVVDVNRDGRPDILFANDGINTIMYGSTSLDFSTVPLGTTSERSLTVDVFHTDDDGYADGVVFGNFDGSTTTHHIDNGQFVSVERVEGRTKPRTQQLVADFNSDGVLDILSGRQIMLGDGSGDFSATAPSLYAPETPRATAAMDVDNDGDLDLIVSSTAGEPTIHALINPGSGDFSQATSVTLGGLLAGHRAVEMKPVDLNGDGYIE